MCATYFTRTNKWIIAELLGKKMFPQVELRQLGDYARDVQKRMKTLIMCNILNLPHFPNRTAPSGFSASVNNTIFISYSCQSNLFQVWWLKILSAFSYSCAPEKSKIKVVGELMPWTHRCNWPRSLFLEARSVPWCVDTSVPVLAFRLLPISMCPFLSLINTISMGLGSTLIYNNLISTLVYMYTELISK